MKHNGHPQAPLLIVVPREAVEGIVDRVTVEALKLLLQPIDACPLSRHVLLEGTLLLHLPACACAAEAERRWASPCCR